MVLSRGLRGSDMFPQLAPAVTPCVLSLRRDIITIISTEGFSVEMILKPHGPRLILFLLFYPNRKKELLSRDDLQLPWRPIYDLYERVVYSKTEHLGLIWFPK